ncbi:hypothetical protein FRB99_006733 [Tulasnella sp. 403]|nr:hypothetical protein FRB99_006733 [Tulasnella sp. 403]
MVDSKKKILFVFTSASKNLKGGPTGYYLPEAAHPYYILVHHHHITFASPDGPNPPPDPHSLEAFKNDEESQRFLQDPTVKEKFDTALKLGDVDPAEYNAVFYVGGHGPVLDLADNPTSIDIVNQFFRASKPTAGVCHGQAAFVNATDADGNPIFKDREVTGFSNVEEESLGLPGIVPWLLEDVIREKGANYVKADAPWSAKVAVDGNLITGENPASSRGVAEAILEALLQKN